MAQIVPVVRKVVATTESVRETFAWEDNYPYEGRRNHVWAAEFDRWLHEHDREVAQRALLYLNVLRGGDIEREYIEDAVKFVAPRAGGAADAY